MQLSVCIITKNEEHNLLRCLDSLKPYDVEIVVADTGSVDATKEVAARYTENIYDFVWCDDFAAAKNYAIEKAKNPYILVLDADEYIQEFDVQGLQRLLSDNPYSVGRIRRINVLGHKGAGRENQEWINRIFAKDIFHYEGRIHEQVAAIDGRDYDTYTAPIVIGHTGYDLPEEERAKKAERNITLLQKELVRLLQENGVKNVSEDIKRCENEGTAAAQVPYILYQLGKGYYMAKDYAAACEYFSQGLSYDLNPKLEYVIDMVETYGYALLNSGKAGDALLFENIYDVFGGSADFKFLMGLIYMNNEMFEKAISEFQKALQFKECRNTGVNSYAANYNIGVIYECLGKLKQAREYYGKCRGYEPAEERIRQINL